MLTFIDENVKLHHMGTIKTKGRKNADPGKPVNFRLTAAQMAGLDSDVDAAGAVAGFKLKRNAYARHAALNHARLRAIETALRESLIDPHASGGVDEVRRAVGSKVIAALARPVL